MDMATFTDSAANVISKCNHNSSGKFHSAEVVIKILEQPELNDFADLLAELGFTSDFLNQYLVLDSSGDVDANSLFFEATEQARWFLVHLHIPAYGALQSEAFIGVEHLVLALMTMKASYVTQALADFKRSRAEVCREIMLMLGPPQMLDTWMLCFKKKIL